MSSIIIYQSYGPCFCRTRTVTWNFQYILLILLLYLNWIVNEGVVEYLYSVVLVLSLQGSKIWVLPPPLSVCMWAHTQTLCWTEQWMNTHPYCESVFKIKILNVGFLIVDDLPVQSWPLRAELRQWTQWRSDTLSAPRVISETWETLYTDWIDKVSLNLYKITSAFLVAVKRSLQNAGNGEMQEGITALRQWHHQTPVASCLHSQTIRLWLNRFEFVMLSVPCRTCSLQKILH